MEILAALGIALVEWTAERSNYSPLEANSQGAGEKNAFVLRQPLAAAEVAAKLAWRKIRALLLVNWLFNLCTFALSRLISRPLYSGIAIRAKNRAGILTNAARFWKKVSFAGAA